MNLLSAFFVSATLAVPQFIRTPVITGFEGGVVEWSADVSCAIPTSLLGARVEFSLDADLDGLGDTAGASLLTASALSPAGCTGEFFPVRRGFDPETPAVLRAEIRVAGSAIDSVADVASSLAGNLGSLLTIRRYCASPKNGEPEWIEIRNVSTVTVLLNKVKLEGRSLGGSLGAGESMIAHAAADTAEMRLWQPAARTYALSSWPGLRNTGDTLRLSVETLGLQESRDYVILDSVLYGAGSGSEEAKGAARAACASAPTEESGAAAHGYALEMTAGRWNRRAGAWEIRVSAPAGESAEDRYALRVFNLDGLEVCALARAATGAQTFSLSSRTCPALSPAATSILLVLQPRRAPGVRRLLWITP